MTDGNVSTLLPRDLLPGIDIYGQNEIYELAQDETSRLQLLDRFLPQDGDYESKSTDVHRRLTENQRKLVKSFSDLDDVKAQVDRLPKLEEQLRGFEELGIKEKLAKTSLIAREREIAKGLLKACGLCKTPLRTLEAACPTSPLSVMKLSKGYLT